MKNFFGGNGFRVIDRADLSSDEVTFSNAWGVCDEDIYRRAVREADASYQRGQNFFSFIMTTSNHRPFTYPEGKIDIPSGDGRAGGVKYADFAVGELIKNASMHPWFDNTIFVFIADHCTRSGGKNEITVENYHIPCIFYGPKTIQPGIVEELTSQIDIAPTLFELLNWQYASSFVGRSVFKAHPGDNRAFASNHLTLGYLKNDMLVTLEPGSKVTSYTVDPTTKAEQVIAPQNSLISEAIAYYQGASSMYENMLEH
jgi:phosphoglycerol transferase MdoB-like AlkP superfamily enzyme